MPHIIVKLWPGREEAKKQKLTERITEAVMEELDVGKDSISVAFEETDKDRWEKEVYIPDIVEKKDKIYKSPGYKY